MKKIFALVCFFLIFGVGYAQRQAPQSLVITNARIIDGNGGVIQRGSVVIRNGRIASVAAGNPNEPGSRQIDVRGMTVMPGFIEDHRHVIAADFPPGDPVKWMKDEAAARMPEFLDAGFTTVQSCGDAPQQIVELQKQLNAGTIKGPRLYTAAFVQLAAPTPQPGVPLGPPRVDPARTDPSRNRPTTPARAIPDEQTRAAVRQLKQAGVDVVKAVLSTTPGGPEEHTLSVVVDEAKKVGMPVFVHAVSVEDTLAAVRTHPDVLVHTPHIGQLTMEQVKTIVGARIPMMSTLGVFIPTFAEQNQRAQKRTGLDNTPRFRDLDPFPMETLSSAGQGPVNARLLWDAGITYGYGTDTTFLPKDSLAQELRALHLVFSAQDIVKIMTKNAAAVIGKSKDIGTLENGKIADLVVIDGDPLASVDDLLKVKTVIKDGQIVVDKRSQVGR
jgi:imidazolonepropionase-like amidohydrolase